MRRWSEDGAVATRQVLEIGDEEEARRWEVFLLYHKVVQNESKPYQNLYHFMGFSAVYRFVPLRVQDAGSVKPAQDFELGTETVTSRGRRRQERPSKSFDELKYMRRGEQLWMGVRAGADQKPVKTRARRLKPSETYRRRQAARAKASAKASAPRRKARR